MQPVDYGPRDLGTLGIRWVLKYVATVTLITLAILGASTPASAGRYYAQTGHILADHFVDFYDASGGLKVFGFPISDPLNLDGKLVQYTERSRLEWDPTTSAVRVGDLGLEYLAGRTFQPVPPVFGVDRLYFPETGHTLANGFLAFWLMYNGREVLGLPLSEEFTEDGLTVQYFQKGRLEYHPELAGTGWEVQLSDLGRRLMQRSGISGTAQSATVTPSEQQLLDLINKARLAQGAPALAIEPALVDVARWRSSDMGTRGYFAHASPEGNTFVTLLDALGIGYSMAAETIARNNYSVADAPLVAFQGFSNSPPHRQIMLSAAYSRAGVGFYRTSDGMNYFTVVYLKP